MESQETVELFPLRLRLIFGKSWTLAEPSSGHTATSRTMTSHTATSHTTRSARRRARTCCLPGIVSTGILWPSASWAACLLLEGYSADIKALPAAVKDMLDFDVAEAGESRPM